MAKNMDGIHLSAANLSELIFVLDYLIEAEEKSYEEYVLEKFEKEFLKERGDKYDFVLEKDFYNRTEIEHIYAITRRVKDALVHRS